MADGGPSISVDGESADGELAEIGKVLAEAVEGYEAEAEAAAAAAEVQSPDYAGSPDVRRGTSRHDSTSSLDAPSGVAAALPASLKKALKEVQKDASVRVAFGDNLTGAFKMVFLGSCELDSKALLECETTAAMERLVSSLLHKVLLSGMIARKVTMVTSSTHVGVVDRVYTSDVIIKHKTSEIAFHGLKTIKQRGNDTASFIVLIAKSPAFNTDVFHAFEGKSNWSKNKLPYVDLALAEAVRTAYENSADDAIDSEMTGNGERVDIAADALVHRAKYIGSSKLAAPNDHWYKSAIMSSLLSDTRDLKKQTKEKTLQHVIDFSNDVVLVAHLEGIRVVHAGNLELLSTPIIPTWVTECKVLDLDEVFNDENSLQLLKDHNRRSKSFKSPRSRRKVARSSSKEVAERLSSMSNLSDDQRDQISDLVDAGSMTPDEAIAEAERIESDSRDCAVLVAWRDDTLDALRLEILVVKGSRSKADAMVRDLNDVVKRAKIRSDDPFQPLTVKKKPRSEVLAGAEVSRDNIIAVQMIGSGQFGEVYLANQVVDVDADEHVQRAVKTLRKGAKKRDKREFCGEAALQLKLSHRNIVKVTGVCMTQEPYLCILEFEPYGDLKKVLSTCEDKGIALAPVEQVWVLKQISDALQYIHSQRFVHMDLATRNALVGEGSIVKVADFGLSRPYDEGDDGYRLCGKMKLPMLWTPPECMPPIVTRGVNEPATGAEIPFYSEQTDVWSFGVCIWEVATYGDQPYGSDGKLLDKLVEIYNGLRLKCPDGTAPDLVKLMDTAFGPSGTRPGFVALSDALHQALVDAGGRQQVRDIGLLLHEGLTKKLSRRSSVIASSVKARKRGMSAHDVSNVAQRVLRSVSEDEELSFGFGADSLPERLPSVTEDEEPPEPEVEAEAGATAVPKKTAKQRWALARRHMQFVVPLVSLHTMRNMSVDSETGMLKRIVDPSSLESTDDPIDADDILNPFDSDDSDLDVDAPLEPIDEDEVFAAASKGFSSLRSNSLESYRRRSDPRGQLPSGGFTDDGGDSDEDGTAIKEEDVDALVEELDDDAAILQLMAERRERHRKEEGERQKVIREQYLKEKAEADAVHAREVAEFEKAKAEEAAALAREKDKIYEEAQKRLEGELEFSFTWGE